MKIKRIIIRGKARLIARDNRGRFIANVKWSSNKQVTERRLRLALVKRKEIKAPKLLAVKAKEPEKEKLNYKQEWRVKLVYDKRGRKGTHPILYELSIITISSKELTEGDIRQMFIDSGICDSVIQQKDPNLPIPEYNKIEIGQVGPTVETDEEEDTKVKFETYTHRIGI